MSRPKLEGVTWSCWCDTWWQIARSLRTVHVDFVAGMAPQSTTSFWLEYVTVTTGRCERILRRAQNMILVSFEIYFVAIWNIFVMIISNFFSTLYFLNVGLIPWSYGRDSIECLQLENYHTRNTSSYFKIASLRFAKHFITLLVLKFQSLLLFYCIIQTKLPFL